jgi:hypothetical protein
MTRVALSHPAGEPTIRVRTAVDSPEVAVALSRLTLSGVVIDLDLAVRRGAGAAVRLHARHGLRDGRVVAVSTVLNGEVEVARFDVARWQRELARSVLVAPPDGCPTPPARVLDVPWDLLVGSGAALARRRPELYDVLVSRAVGSVRGDGVLLGAADCHEQIRRLHHSAAGRLRVVGSGPSPRGRRVGWVSWLLFEDGWRALTPYAGPVAGGSRLAMVRVEPRDPRDLGLDVARWVAAVSA